MATWAKYAFTGAIALGIGLLIGMFVIALRPVEPPTIAALQPIMSDVASRRFVLIDPHKKCTILYETMGGKLQEIDRKNY